MYIIAVFAPICNLNCICQPLIQKKYRITPKSYPVFDSFLTLDCAADTGRIVLLSRNEQRCDGDGNDDRGSREGAEPLVDVFHFQHLIHTDSDGIVILVGTTQNLCQHKIFERTGKEVSSV